MARALVVVLFLVVAAAPAAALDVVRVRTPNRVKLTARHVARSVRAVVTMRNETSGTVSFPDAAALAAALGLSAAPSDGPIVCPALALEPASSVRFPLTLRAGRRRSVGYRLGVTCGANPGAGGDWTLTALGTSATIDVIDRRASTAFQLPGRYLVGTTSMTLVDGSRPTMPNGTYPGAPDRTFPTLVWYPAAAEGTDVPVAADGAPFPLVIFGHGLGSPPNQSARYTAHLASHGYVVVAPAFPLSKLGAPGGQTLADTPNEAGDVSFFIDTFLAFSSTSGERFAGAIDPERIAATGHSGGGLLTLVATYDAIVRDARIKAAIAMSPPACWFQPGYFGNVAVPLLLLHGDNDLLVDFATHAEAAYERANVPKSLLRVRHGNHLGFADFGTLIDDVQGCGFLPPADDLATQTMAFVTNMGGAANHVTLDGCEGATGYCQGDPSHLDGARQMQIAKQTAAAFLDMLFRGDAAGARYLYEELGTTSPDVAHDFVR
ncbi:MAG: alpha/beta hydrolase family protein [Candidatus Binatia bacterium]